jgi:hypothetical protein
MIAYWNTFIKNMVIQMTGRLQAVNHPGFQGSRRDKNAMDVVREMAN